MKCVMCSGVIKTEHAGGDSNHGVAVKLSCDCVGKPTLPAYYSGVYVSPQAMQDILKWDEETKKKARWDRDFLALAKFWAERKSKDPSTKVGAVIVGPDREIVSLGYNGFAQGVEDKQERLQDRSTRLSLTVHAEINAVLFSRRPTLEGCTVVTWPFGPCAACCAVLIQKKIARVVCPPTPPAIAERWGESLKLAEAQFREAGVVVDYVSLEETKS